MAEALDKNLQHYSSPFPSLEEARHNAKRTRFTGYIVCAGSWYLEDTGRYYYETPMHYFLAT